jgi:hypothetical protein
MDTETWKFINSFAPWFSAYGTLLAVIVALYLATSARRITFKVNAGLKSITTSDLFDRKKTNKGVYLSATNTGSRTARVISFSWRCGFLKKHWTVQPSSKNEHSTPFPQDVYDGEEVRYWIPIEMFAQNIKRFFPSEFAKKYPELYVKSLRIEVSTSAGAQPSGKVEKPLQEHIVFLLKKEFPAGDTV